MTGIRWGMIGCGSVAERKSGPAFSRIPGSRLTSVTSRSPDRAREYAARHSIPHVHETPEALIASDQVDAVYIATPPASHLELALMVAAAGKPCCVEKPIAINHAEADRMLRAFSSAGLPLFVSYYRRSLPRFETVRAWLTGEAIGTIRHVHWSLTRTPSESDLRGDLGWRVDPRQAPGGYFDDLAVHGLDLFDHFFGPVADVAGFTRQQAGLYPVPDAVTACWVHENGITGSGHWNFAADESIDKVRISGSHGHIEFSVLAEAPVVLSSQEGVQTHTIVHPEFIQEPHIAAMVKHLTDGTAHPSTGESAARTARVCDRILALQY